MTPHCSRQTFLIDYFTASVCRQMQTSLLPHRTTLPHKQCLLSYFSSSFLAVRLTFAIPSTCQCKADGPQAVLGIPRATLYFEATARVSIKAGIREEYGFGPCTLRIRSQTHASISMGHPSGAIRTIPTFVPSLDGRPD